MKKIKNILGICYTIGTLFLVVYLMAPWGFVPLLAGILLGWPFMMGIGAILYSGLFNR